MGASWGAPGSFLRCSQDVPDTLWGAVWTVWARFGQPFGYLWVISGMFLATSVRKSIETQLQAPILSVFSRFFDRFTHRFLAWYFLLSAIVLASVQSFFLQGANVAQQAGNSCPTSIFLHMASVLQGFCEIVHFCTMAKNDKQSDRKAIALSIERA